MKELSHISIENKMYFRAQFGRYLVAASTDRFVFIFINVPGIYPVFIGRGKVNGNLEQEYWKFIFQPSDLPLTEIAQWAWNAPINYGWTYSALHNIGTHIVPIEMQEEARKCANRFDAEFYSLC